MFILSRNYFKKPVSTIPEGYDIFYINVSTLNEVILNQGFVHVFGQIDKLSAY